MRYCGTVTDLWSAIVVRRYIEVSRAPLGVGQAS
jgi:hypothetical protein